jgi:hypothetical protein
VRIQVTNFKLGIIYSTQKQKKYLNQWLI